MVWRIESDDSIFETGPGGNVGDPVTVARIDAMDGKPVPKGPGLGMYRAAGPSDPVWLYLAALAAIPAPREITGTPPDVPADSGNYPADAVF